MGRPSSIADAVHDARWLAHRYDPGRDAVHFLAVQRAEHRRATFLTDEYLPKGLEQLVIRRDDAIAAMPPAGPLHFIFHSAYCCSTLVAQAMDRCGWAMGLKEPPILNDIVGWRRRGDGGPDITKALADVLTLLARPFEAGEAVIVKPSTVVNSLAATMLALRPDARALLLYAPLRTYLGSIARKGLDGRLWVRTLLTGMIDDGLVDLGFTTADYLGQTDLQVAAVGWLAHQKLFSHLAQQFGPARIRIIDSATLMSEPHAAIAALATLFGREADSSTIDGIVSGPAFRTHSKLGTDFDAEKRAQQLRTEAAAHEDEIEKVAHWAEVVAAHAGISLAPGPALTN